MNRTLFLIVGCLVTISCLAACQQAASPDDDGAIVGDPTVGEDLFHNGMDDMPACSVCHATVEGEYPATSFTAGPNLAQLTNRIDQNIFEDYVSESILDPAAVVVEGFANNMYSGYGDILSEQQLQDIIAYLKTL